MINFKRLSLAILAVLVVAAIAFYIWLQSVYVVPILMYHSISPSHDKKLFEVLASPPGVELRLNVVSPRSFDRQMGYLVKHHFHVLSLDDFFKMRQAGIRFSHKTVVITFDDGYADNYTYAFPILKKYHLPATIFLITDYVGKNPNLLTWAEVKEMQANGISFGSHTRHHAYLPNVSKQQAVDEIVGSKRILEAELGKPVYYFAYPCGGFSEEIKGMVAMAGYKCALATNRGYDRYDIDPFELSRIRVNNWDGKFVLFSKFSGYYNLFRGLRPSH